DAPAAPVAPPPAPAPAPAAEPAQPAEPAEAAEAAEAAELRTAAQASGSAWPVPLAVGAGLGIALLAGWAGARTLRQRAASTH
ncbi:hypothetical protein, partial [Geodermatophilus sp. CPCC 206100]|uniref:hypothetical protein n=1 Tax=Geodermatophilus sp. CPCC 206100 TaxID=3020054 RepID=UPI003B00E607